MSCGNEEYSVFDKIIEAIGNDGRFQKIFNYVFNLALVIFTAMTYLNITLALTVPEHWCHVPGRDRTNLTVEEWKNLTLPKEVDTRGRISTSKCKMYNFSYTVEDFPVYRNSTSLAAIDCQYGWDYDQRWYLETASSQQNWVCNNELYSTNAIVFNRVGDVVGTIIFGHLGDMFGRKPVYYATLVNLIVGRLLSIITSDTFYLFAIALLMGSLTSTSVFQSPLVIAMEISKNDNRAYIAMLQCLGWSIGLCILPLMQWYFGYWREFMLVTTLPCILFLLPYRYMIESPRWLASRGKIKECMRELKRVAEVNRTSIPADTMLLLKKNNEGPSEKSYGVMSLFSSFRLARNTFLLVFCWVITSITYYVLILNVNQLGGNPHLNFLWQALAEYPAYLLGKMSSDRYGRRWTEILAFFATALVCIPLALVVVNPELEVVASALAAFIKFLISFCFFAINLQALEIYPTCVRQSGLSLGAFFSNAFCIIGPYIAYLGTTSDARLPYVILGVLCVFGGIAGFFLPETLNMKLPETLVEAHEFGANQNLWSFSKKSVKRNKGKFESVKV